MPSHSESKSSPAKRAARAEVTWEKGPHGQFDVAVAVKGAEGEVQFGLSLEEAGEGAKRLGLFVAAPEVERFSVGAIIEASGLTRIASALREAVSGEPIPTVLGDVDSLERRLVTFGKLSASEHAATEAASEGLDAALQRNAHLEKSVIAAQKELTALRRELESSRSSASSTATEKDEAIQKLSAELAELTELKASMEQAAARHEAVEVELESKTAEVAMLQRDYQGLKESYATSEVRCAKLKSDKEAKVQDLQRSMAERVKLQGEVDAAKARTVQLESEMAAAHQRQNDLQQSLKAETAGRSKSEKLANERGEQIAGLDQRREEALRRLEEAVTQKETFKLEAERLGGEVEDAKKREDSLRKELASQKDLVEAQREELEGEQKRREELLVDINFVRSQVAKLTENKSDLITRLDSIANREQKRRTAATEMSSMLRDAEVIASDKAARLRRAEGKVGQLEQSSAQLQAQVATLEAQVAELSQGKELADAQVQSLTKERDELKVELDFARRQIVANQRTKGGPASGMTPAPAPTPSPAPAPARPAPLGRTATAELARAGAASLRSPTAAPARHAPVSRQVNTEVTVEAELFPLPPDALPTAEVRKPPAATPAKKFGAK